MAVVDARIGGYECRAARATASSATEPKVSSLDGSSKTAAVEQVDQLFAIEPTGKAYVARASAEACLRRRPSPPMTTDLRKFTAASMIRSTFFNGETTGENNALNLADAAWVYPESVCGGCHYLNTGCAELLHVAL